MNEARELRVFVFFGFDGTLDEAAREVERVLGCPFTFQHPDHPEDNPTYRALPLGLHLSLKIREPFDGRRMYSLVGGTRHEFRAEQGLEVSIDRLILSRLAFAGNFAPLWTFEEYRNRPRP
ncbi:hypothetical protein L6R52_36945 [Myxococcota bacterium]|nr:hypothetical protein [Myxococcota bacterium]